MGPIITGLVVSGRVGAGIGAELASMKVTEQIDAIEASAINPYRLLAATRILACILMLPLLTLATDACALLTGWLSGSSRAFRECARAEAPRAWAAQPQTQWSWHRSSLYWPTLCW